MGEHPQNKPLVLSCGEPAGIGPEITILAWAALRHNREFCFFWIGDGDFLAQRAKASGLTLSLQKINHPHEASDCFAHALPLLHRPFQAPVYLGAPSPLTAGSVLASLQEAFDFVLKGEASALVTNPIQKEALYEAGFAFQGHTDYLAHLAHKNGHKAQEVMMLIAQDLRAVPATIHIPLAEVAPSLTTDLIIAQAEIILQSLKTYFAIKEPRLAITGLNPHAGEGGKMGLEEQLIIQPAITHLRAKGHKITGPHPADTAFHEEARARYDAILCMYHDQALIPVKTLDFHGGVNVTLGLPIIRTSPDHGTALDLVGLGTARPDSLIQAIMRATAMAQCAKL